MQITKRILSLTLATGLFITATSNVFAEVSFKDDVFPILELRCLSCHVPGAEGYEASGLDMRTYESLMKGTNHGPVIKPNSALESNLMAVVERRTSKELWMPHDKKKLSKCETKALRHWISQGARKN